MTTTSESKTAGQTLTKIHKALSVLASGQEPKMIPVELDDNEQIRDVATIVNRFAVERKCMAEIIGEIGKGNLAVSINCNSVVANQVKALQASLRHLTWQTNQIAQGDFDQRVDFMGDFSEAFNSMVVKLKQHRDEILERNRLLQEAVDEIKTLQGIIPICMHCHKIRSDDDSWERMEAYVEGHSKAQFSHSICPKCSDEHYSDD